jgi:hypothetical protein
VHVERAAAHRREKRFRNLVPVRGPHQDLGAQGEYGRDLFVVEARRLTDRKAHRASRHLDRRLPHDAARRRTVGLRDDSGDLNDAALAKTIKGLERAGSERRCAEEQRALC